MVFRHQPAMDWPTQISSYYQGTPGAFDPIFNHWFPRFVSHARLSGLRDADAQDAALETLYKVARTLDPGSRYDPSRGAAFSTWIYKIAYHVRLDFIRRQKSDHSVPAEDNVLESIPATEKGPYHVTVQHRFGKDLEDCLRNMDGAHREVFVLREIEEQTLDQIAATIDLSISAVHRLVARVKTQLRACLSQKGYGQEATA
jgi:RNA polymerase sigma-70 factor (ECF subfamily)